MWRIIVGGCSSETGCGFFEPRITASSCRAYIQWKKSPRNQREAEMNLTVQPGSPEAMLYPLDDDEQTDLLVLDFGLQPDLSRGAGPRFNERWAREDTSCL